MFFLAYLTTVRLGLFFMIIILIASRALKAYKTLSGVQVEQAEIGRLVLFLWFEDFFSSQKQLLAMAWMNESFNRRVEWLFPTSVK